MRKVKLFIAMSLDGYIADPNGKVDWLEDSNNGEEAVDTYSNFIKDIDTILMGWKTYNQIATELSPQEWIYNQCKTYVLTHRKQMTPDIDNEIYFTDENLYDLVEKLKKENGKDIWICGGAYLVQQLINADLIDYYYLTIIPTVLGSGIRLFDNLDHQINLNLISTQSCNGIVDLIYKREN